MTTPVPLLVADDHPIVRQGIVRVIEKDPAFRIVAECGDGNEAMATLRTGSVRIAVLDISMPGLSGLEIVKLATRERIPVQFLVLTMYRDEEYLEEAMDLGVKGYILKDSAIRELLAGLHAVAEGRYFISPLVSGFLVDRERRRKALSRDLPALADLTPSERNILRLIAENKTSKEIADTLIVSYRTVQNHRANICRKLGFRGHNRLLQFALEHRGVL